MNNLRLAPLLFGSLLRRRNDFSWAGQRCAEFLPARNAGHVSKHLGSGVSPLIWLLWLMVVSRVLLSRGPTAHAAW
jgi:hypothetical protein